MSEPKMMAWAVAISTDSAVAQNAILAPDEKIGLLVAFQQMARGRPSLLEDTITGVTMTPLDEGFLRAALNGGQTAEVVALKPVEPSPHTDEPEPGAP